MKTHITTSAEPPASRGQHWHQAIADTYFRLLKPGGVLSYFEYMYVRPVRKVMTSGAERIRITAIDETLRGYCDRCRIRRDNIWMNIPPAWVQHLRKES